MANIDLKNLIDTIVGMARESMDLRKRYTGENGKDKDEEYWKEIRRRNTELELRGAEGKNRLAEREMINAGDLEKQRVSDAGALARQGLANEASRYTADKGFDSHRYTADTNYAMKRDELNKGYDPELIKAHAAVIANVNSSPEAVASSQAAIDWYTKEATKKRQPAREALTETPQALPTPAPVQDVGGSVGKFLGENPSTGPSVADINAFRGKSAPGPSIFSPNDQPWMRPLDGLSSGASAAPASAATPPSGFGGSVGKVLYGATHPFETAEKPLTFTRASSPARDAIDKAAFETFPNAVKDTAKAAVEGTAEFGRNVSRGYDAKKEEEAKRKRKNLGYM